MSGVGQKERATQNRVIELFKSKLKYTYIGNLHDRENSNIEKAKLNKYLQRQGLLCRTYPPGDERPAGSGPKAGSVPG